MKDNDNSGRGGVDVEKLREEGWELREFSTYHAYHHVLTTNIFLTYHGLFVLPRIATNFHEFSLTKHIPQCPACQAQAKLCALLRIPRFPLDLQVIRKVSSFMLTFVKS